MLAACASSDPLPMIATGTVTPHLTDSAYVGVDGAELPLKSWLPEDGHIKAVVLAVHGINDYSHAFDTPAKIWAQDGIATYAYDQRGFGAAPLRGRWVGTYQLDSDVTTIAATGWAGAERPDVDGLILVAPAVWGEQTMNIFYRTALWVADHVAPKMQLSGSGLHILPSDNIPMLREFSRDPLVIKETRVDTIRGLVQIMSEALEAAPQVKQRTLLLYGAHDELVPAEPVKEFVDALPRRSSEDTVAYYDAGYHMLLRDLDGAKVATDVEDWIFHPDSPLPSGADIAGAEKFLPPVAATLNAKVGIQARAN
jgi:alpha-beta hydrolase superfamily lysophospholipase